MLIKYLSVDRSNIDPVPISYVPGTNTGSIHDWWIVAQPARRCYFSIYQLSIYPAFLSNLSTQPTYSICLLNLPTQSTYSIYLLNLPTQSACPICLSNLPTQSAYS